LGTDEIHWPLTFYLASLPLARKAKKRFGVFGIRVITRSCFDEAVDQVFEWAVIIGRARPHLVEEAVKSRWGESADALKRFLPEGVAAVDELLADPDPSRVRRALVEVASNLFGPRANTSVDEIEAMEYLETFAVVGMEFGARRPEDSRRLVESYLPYKAHKSYEDLERAALWLVDVWRRDYE
jgi:hypothetical protein